MQAALRTYLSDLRMEIRDTDNPGYKRGLRSEREALESALAKLDGGSHAGTTTPQAGDGGVVTVVRMWWTSPPK